MGQAHQIGAPHFVDFGQNLHNSPDGEAYLVAQGATDGAERRFGFLSWITADQAYLLRVRPPLIGQRRLPLQFFAGRATSGRPIWTHDLAASRPIAEWRDHMGCVTATYLPALRKYILCVTDGTSTATTGPPFSSYLLESDDLGGPWKLVEYLKDFGPWAYFVNIPTKFVSADNLTFWLCYAANFSMRQAIPGMPIGSRLGMILREVMLLRR